MTKESPTFSQNALAYFYNRGGLNNQKLALFGLLLKAFREGPPRIVLPNLVLFNQITFDHKPVGFDQEMRLGPLLDFASRRGIEIVHEPPRGDEGAWDYFHYGNNYIPCAALLNELGPAGFVCDFFRSIVPVMRGSEMLGRLIDIAFVQNRIRIALQLRIEKDWAHHTTHRLNRTSSDFEDNAPSFKDILAKVCNTFSELGSRVYVVCDEAALPAAKDEIRGSVKQDYGLDLFWKSDFLGADEFNALSTLDLSILDFEMAMAAESFVGLSRSTFSNMLSLEKYARHGTPVRHHYIYNVSGPRLGLRTDNGAFSVPKLATAADPWAPELSFHLAQIFLSNGERRRALDQYAARADLGGPALEETFISLYRAAQLKAELEFSARDVIDTYLRAAAIVPSRAEARHGASRHCRINGMFREGREIAKSAINLPAPAEGLFVEPWIYEWAALDEYAVNAYWDGHFRDSLGACLEILARNGLPDDHRARIVANARAAFHNLPKGPEPQP